MATKTKWRTISLPIELLDKVKDVVEAAPEYSSVSDFVKKATAKELRESTTQPSSLTIDDKIFLEVIAQDHWAQYHSFEEEDVVESILIEFKQDPEKPKNKAWLNQAVEFVCSQKRN